MSTITVQELTQNPLVFLNRVAAGERLVVSHNGHPIAELRPCPTVLATPRPFGLAAGAFVVPDDFDAPLPEEILQQFEGK